MTTMSASAGVAVALARLGADLLAELRQPLLVAAVRDRLLDPGQRLADAGDLGAGLAAAADHAERPRPGRARYFAATALAAPVRSCPSRSASITARSSPRSNRTTTNARPRRSPSRSSRRRAHARGRPPTSPPGTPPLEPHPVARHVLDRPAASRRNESSTASIASAGVSSRSVELRDDDRAGRDHWVLGFRVAAGCGRPAGAADAAAGPASGPPCDSSVSSGGLGLGVGCARREGQCPVLVHVAVD